MSLAAAAALVAVPAEGAPKSAVVPGSSAQHALAVAVDGAGVTARACAAGASCSAAGGQTFPFPAGVEADKATIEVVELGGDKALAIVSAKKKGGGSYVFLLAASAPPDGPAVLKPLSGTIDAPKGMEGERISDVLVREAITGGTRVVVGKRYEHVGLCGRPTTLQASALDPDTMSWEPTAPVALTAAERAAAPRLGAVRTSAFPAGGAKLIEGLAASSAVGKDRAGLTDGDLATRWAEAKRGEGAGEFLVMNAAAGVPITGFDLVIRPTVEIAGGAAPKTFYLVVGAASFHVTMPEDAWTAPAGQSYHVELPSPVESECVAVVLDEAFTSEGHGDVSIAELAASSGGSATSVEELAARLGGDGADAEAAKAILARGGDAAVQATMGVWDKLDRSGKNRALDVLELGDCKLTASFYVDRLLGRGENDKDFEPDLDPLARRARERLRECKGEGAAALSAAVKKEEPGLRRVWAARELADVDPAGAIGVILEVIEQGSLAPKGSGSNDEVRRGLRRGLAAAVRNKRAAAAVDATLAQDRFAALSLVQRIDLLRAIGPSLAQHAAPAGAALAATLAGDASFRTRFLLLGPASQLARSGDAGALAFLKKSLASDKSEKIRARAAELAAGVKALAREELAALVDRAPRVREAALEGMAAEGALPTGAEARVIDLLTADRWTFVREGAARALAHLPASAAADEALVAALDDDSFKVRVAALMALGDRRALSAADRVHDLADNANETITIRTTAIAALGSMCHADSAELLYKLALRAGAQQLPYDLPLALAALGALGALKPPDLKARLQPLLQRNARVPPHVRAITRDVLGRPGSCGKKKKR